jgi:hypothetical protein
MKKSESIAEKKKSVIAAKPGAGVSAREPVAATMRVRVARFFILIAGVVVTHFVLFAPSLLGLKVLLPVDYLAHPSVYLPMNRDGGDVRPLDPAFADVKPLNPALSDQVFQFEFQRRFAAREFRAGRIPLWDPYNYCGAPFVVPFFTPFNIPYYVFPHYITLAWTHVLVALVASGGAFVFFRRSLGVGFWPAAVAAWCYPLTGFFELWLGFYLSYTAAFLPWLFVAVESIVRRPLGWGGPGLALTTGLLLVSGAFDLAGQALLASGLFAVWRLGETFLRDRKPRALAGPVAALTTGWVLGFLLAAPYWAPLTEYANTGLRIKGRADSETIEERPPIGWKALPQFFVPYIFGSTWPGWPWVSRSPNLQESAVQGYAGLFAALVLAPVGLAVRRLRSLNIFWLLLILLASSWILALPGFTAFLRLPVMNLMSHNRFLFVVVFAVLALAAAGLDAVANGEVVWRRAFFAPLALLAAIGLGCVLEAVMIDVVVPLDATHNAGGITASDSNPAAIAVARTLLRNYAIEAALTCAAAGLLWLLIVRATPRVAVPLLGVALLADLLWFGRGQNPQNDPALYFPAIPSLERLEQLTETAPGRVTGLTCLPPMMAQRFWLQDVRGYDAVDPARIVNLLLAVREPKSGVLGYARTQWWMPAFLQTPAGELKLFPAVNMLNLRYLIGRGNSPPDARFKPIVVNGDDYWVFENRDALPRVYVPPSVEAHGEKRIFQTITQAPAAFEFNPRAVAYVEDRIDLHGECKGSAEIVSETPCEIRVDANMETAGLLVLADQWYDGWKAYLDGAPLPVLKVNYALRGVRLPAGHGEVVFRYEPAGWSRGVKAFGFALPAVAAWSLAVAWFGRRRVATVPAT